MSLVRLCIVYVHVVKEVAPFHGLGQLMGVVRIECMLELYSKDQEEEAAYI